MIAEISPQKLITQNPTQWDIQAGFLFVRKGVAFNSHELLIFYNIMYESRQSVVFIQPMFLFDFTYKTVVWL